MNPQPLTALLPAGAPGLRRSLTRREISARSAACSGSPSGAVSPPGHSYGGSWAAAPAPVRAPGRRGGGSGPAAACAPSGAHLGITRFCAQDESARNAGGTPGCGTADGAARRTRGTRTGAPPVPAGRGCRRPACGAPAEREASAALAVPVRTRNACTRVRTHRTGSLAPRPAVCRAAAARAAGCPMRSCIHGRTAVSPVGTTR